MRVGPGEDYRINWVYHRAHLPVKVLRVMEGWRLIEDPDGARGWVLALWSLLAIAAAWRWCPALLVAAPAAMLWGLWLRRRIGGISGDGHGAGIELLETAMLLAAACA